jgi:chlorophyllase-like protein
VGATSQPLGFPAPRVSRFARDTSGTGRAHKLAIRSTPEIRYGSNGFRALTCFEVPLHPHCIPPAESASNLLHKYVRSPPIQQRRPGAGRATLIDSPTMRSSDDARQSRPTHRRSTWKRVARTLLSAFFLAALIPGLVFAEFYFGLALMPAPHSEGSLTLPELTGRFPVGRRYLEWVDRSRRDPFHPSRPRELVISVWYPAQANPSIQTGVYLPGPRGGEAARLQSILIRVRSQGLGSALLRNPLPREFFLGITTRAVEDAPVSIAQPVFPVLLFMPGYGAMPTEYTALLEDIASHGYIVVGITPAGFVPVTVFDDGRKIYAPLWNLSLYKLEKVFPVWVQDSRFVLDQVSEQNKDPQSPFFGHIDMSRVGVLGHSFGGAASAALAILIRAFGLE